MTTLRPTPTLAGAVAALLAVAAVHGVLAGAVFVLSRGAWGLWPAVAAAALFFHVARNVIVHRWGARLRDAFRAAGARDRAWGRRMPPGLRLFLVWSVNHTYGDPVGAYDGNITLAEKVGALIEKALGRREAERRAAPERGA